MCIANPCVGTPGTRSELVGVAKKTLKIMKTSEILKVNIAQILVNWSKDYIRADWSDMSAYVNARAIEYAAITADKDMSRQKCLEYIRTAFLVPVKVLTYEIRKQRIMGQFKWVIDELNEAIKYYQS